MGWDVYKISVRKLNSPPDVPQPLEGKQENNPLFIWSPNEEEWIVPNEDWELYSIGGGRYSKKTVVITLDAFGNGQIYLSHNFLLEEV